MIEMLGKLEVGAKDDLWRDKQSREGANCVYFEYVHLPSYAEDRTPVPLAVLFLRDPVHDTPYDTCLISDKPTEMRVAVCAQNHHATSATNATLFAEVARLTGLTPLELTRPLRLAPVFIPKPWGREIWYTGIESRGMSSMQDIPIAWILDIFGGLLAGDDTDTWTAPILLKILDPHPLENLGDLYFEIHTKKVEVYVVTGLDAAAWPEGVGQIRYGFNQALLQSYSSQANFLQDYLTSVEAYRKVRYQIDALLDDIKRKAGKDPNQAISPETQAQWHTQLPKPLLVEEGRRREAMYAYTAVHDVAVGDVIQVQPFTPHSLQHGVRVIEFQTPHYERFILSFGQKVLTQPDWDTQEALPLATTDKTEPGSVKEMSPGIDQIADFDQFQVLRLRIADGDSKMLHCKGYALAIGILGEVDINRAVAEKQAQKRAGRDARVLPEEAVYIPAAREQLQFTNVGSEPASILVAFPPGG